MSQILSSSAQYTLLGSCFVLHVGERMLREGWRAMVNPLGTLYNPESIRVTLRQALCGKAENLPIFYDPAMREYRCWWANTQWRADSEEECRSLIQKRFGELGEWLRGSDRLFITLGTNVCYQVKELATPGTLDGVCVNCQRQPDVLFSELRLKPDEVLECLEDIQRTCTEFAPDLHVTYTVSPYRYKKYGLHGSQLSKAVLLLAVDEMCQRHPDRVDYFPSYEIMMDELRDYRYYQPDGLHPSAEAVDIIWNRLTSKK